MHLIDTPVIIGKFFISYSGRGGGGDGSSGIILIIVISCFIRSSKTFVDTIRVIISLTIAKRKTPIPVIY